jgi:hypothetical protein
MANAFFELCVIISEAGSEVHYHFFVIDEKTVRKSVSQYLEEAA